MTLRRTHCFENNILILRLHKTKVYIQFFPNQIFGNLYIFILTILKKVVLTTYSREQTMINKMDPLSANGHRGKQELQQRKKRSNKQFQGSSTEVKQCQQRKG